MRQLPAKVPHDEADRFGVPGVRDWLSFSTEAVQRNNLVLIVGIAAAAPLDNSGPLDNSSPIGRLLRPMDAEGGLVRAFSRRRLSAPAAQEADAAFAIVGARSCSNRARSRTCLHLLRDDRPITGQRRVATLRRGVLDWYYRRDHGPRGTVHDAACRIADDRADPFAVGVRDSDHVSRRRFEDLTVDGSFTLGGAVAAMLIVQGTNPIFATLCGALAGGDGRRCDGDVATHFGINRLLAGILVMTALYSVNLRVMGKSTISSFPHTDDGLRVELADMALRHAIGAALCRLGGESPRRVRPCFDRPWSPRFRLAAVRVLSHERRAGDAGHRRQQPDDPRVGRQRRADDDRRLVPRQRPDWSVGSALSLSTRALPTCRWGSACWCGASPA